MAITIDPEVTAKFLESREKLHVFKSKSDADDAEMLSRAMSALTPDADAANAAADSAMMPGRVMEATVEQSDVVLHTLVAPPPRYGRLSHEVHDLPVANDAAAQLRRWMAPGTQTPGSVWANVEKVLAALDAVTAERGQLRNAIRLAGFAVCHTSGDWTMHDVSELGKEDERRTREVINESIDLGIEVKRLRAVVEHLRMSLADCLAIVAIQNGNLHADVNEIQERATAALAKAVEAMERKVAQ